MVEAEKLTLEEKCEPETFHFTPIYKKGTVTDLQGYEQFEEDENRLVHVICKYIPLQYDWVAKSMYSNKQYYKRMPYIWYHSTAQKADYYVEM